VTCASPGPVSGNFEDDFVTIPAYKYLTYSVFAHVKTTTTGNLTNIARFDLPAGWSGTTPVTATDTDNHPTADLGVTNTDGVNLFAGGQVLTYIIRVTNNGPSKVIGASFTDSFTTGGTKVLSWIWTCTSTTGATCIAGSFAPGTTFTDTVTIPARGYVEYTAKVTIVASPGAGNLVNHAHIDSPTVPPNDVPDPGPTSNTADDTDTQ